MTAASQPEAVVLRAARLLDGSGAEPIADAALWLEGDRIAWVGPGDALPVEAC
jgi:imidazolonepropionase-like amidohydrolase